MSDNVIELLVVDDIPETRENLKKLLYFENDIEVIGTAQSGEEAIEMVQELYPDVVLMDINMPGIDGISTVEHLLRESPGTQVIMMSVQGETDYLRRSMLAGAREFLIKPFTAEELTASIRRVHDLGEQQGGKKPKAAQAEPAQQQPVQRTPHDRSPTDMVPAQQQPNGRQSHIICGFGAKGGVGTSTVMANMAMALHEQRPNARAALLDLDLQFGSVGVILNLESDRTILDISSHIDEADAQFVEEVMITHTSGLYVLLAPPSPVDAERITPDTVKKILHLLREQFDYIFIDTRTILNDVTLAALDEADAILLMTTAEIPAVKNAKTFFDVAEQLDYSPSKITLVLNKYDQRVGISADAIKNSISYPITSTIPMDMQVTGNAVNQGVPFVLNQSRTDVAREVIQLTSEMIKLVEPDHVHGNSRQPEKSAEEEPKKKRSLFSRLFGR